ncbi:pentatricopeptide repeat-containing protein At3g03580-like [Typha latifolia]|uniref:pentatricopeptide repeat-containing protein At3g03580-like n=1 Tax=Typha latifolia TaxID=4733 RepID=UPI003C2B0533
MNVLRILNKSAALSFKLLRSQSSAPFSIQSVVVDPDISTVNKLIDCYSRSGDLVSARKMFDEMPRRDVVSWNSIMTAYSREGQYNEVLRMVLEMHSLGLRPNYTSVSTVLFACAKLRALRQGEQIHAISIKSQCSANVFVGTSLITMYANCSVFDCLVWVLDGIDSPSIATWNAMISGYVLNHRIGDARRVFDQMPSRNVVSWTAMISGFIKVKKVRTAFELFHLMPVKNSVSWSVMLGGFVSIEQYAEAIKLFIYMIRNGVKTTRAVVVKVITAFSGLESIRDGKTIHGYVIKSGFHLDQGIEASLVLMYCKSLDMKEARLEFNKLESKYIGSWNILMHGYINQKKVHEARKLFDSMYKKDRISWNSMIEGYLKDNRIGDALELFSKMPEPTVEATTSLISSFVDNGRLEEAEKLFNAMLQLDAMAYTAMIYGYMKEGLLENAWELFHKMPVRSCVTYNVMISGMLRLGKVTEAYKLFKKCPENDAASWHSFITGLVQNGLFAEAFLFYKKMATSGISPSELVIASLLSSSSQLSMLILGQQLHTVAVKLGLQLYLIVGNSLINMYCKCGDMAIAKQVFDGMADRDIVTWNTMVYGYALNSLGEKAIQTFENMKKTSIKPDEVTLLAILFACSHMCLLEEAHRYFSSMEHDYGVVPKLQHYACMVDLLCRKGMVEKAERLVKSMPCHPDSAVWTSLLSGCLLNWNDKLAEHAANQLFACDQRDQMPYLHPINIYGSVEKSNNMGTFRNKLKELYSNKQPGCSWI